MNNVKLYRAMPDGRVEITRVKITQSKAALWNPSIRTRFPTVDEAVRELGKQGWTREKLKPQVSFERLRELELARLAAEDRAFRPAEALAMI